MFVVHQAVVAAAVGSISLLLGLLIGGGALLLPLMVIVIGLGLAMFFALPKGVHLEAVVLSFLTVGYFIGNRGFAQLNVHFGLPLYVGELGLVFCIVALFFRLALDRRDVFPRNGVTLLLGLFLLFGFIRFLLDVGEHRQLAARDFAAVYYSIFFFVAYHVGRSEASRRFFVKGMEAGFVGATVSAVLILLVPEWLERNLAGQMLLMVSKGDLLAIFVGAASLHFFYKWHHGGKSRLNAVFSGLSFFMMLLLECRGVYVGIALAVGLMILARKRAYLMFQSAIAIVGLVIYLLVYSVSGKPLEESPPYRITMELVSMADFSGTKSYATDRAASSAQNNRFRWFWWKAVVDETWEKGPIFGLGFGYDMSRRFLYTYEANLGMSFDARSPHNYFLTIYGRMGLVGAGLLAALLGALALTAVREAKEARDSTQPPEGIYWWGMLWVFLGSAIFGVVLEGPMAAIPFWTMLGIWFGRLASARETEPVASGASQMIPFSPRLRRA